MTELKAADIFLSYNREDQTVARRFADGLIRAGFSVWWDVTLKSGEDYDKATEQALRNAKAVVVLWSERSVVSRWVRTEATIALQQNKLVPVMIEPCQRPIMFELSQTADLASWKGDDKDTAWQLLLADIHDLTNGRSAASSHSSIGSSKPAAKDSPFAAQLLVGIVGLLIVVMLGLNLLRLGSSDDADAASEVAAAPASPAGASQSATIAESAVSANPRTAVAVMAFANLTGDASKDYLGEGMSEELINTLGKIPGLKVPSRTSTFAYRGRNADLTQIASDLGVGTVLEGSVRSAGNTIRITATLIDAQTDRQLWSETYDREFTDLFKLQDELARAIVQELQGQLSPAAQQTLARAQPTQNLEAYSLFLQANQMAQNGALFDSPEQFLDLYDEAIALDPGFAMAYAYKAGVQTTLTLVGRLPPSVLGEAEASARQALALDPSLAEAEAALGIIEAYKGNWLAAEQHYARGGTATRTGFDAAYASMLLESGGYLRRADNSLRQIYLAAPAAPMLAMQYAANHSLMGNDADAMRYISLALDLGLAPNAIPVPQIKANAAYRSGDPVEAGEHLVAGMLPPVRNAGGEAVVRQVYAALAEPDKKPAAVQVLQQFIEQIGSANLDPNTRKDFIASFTMLGALDEAFALTNAVLDDYAKNGVIGYAWGVLWLPEMRPFRQDRRFQDIARRLKLFDYWQQYGPPDGCMLEADSVVCQ